ncbi:hypothetical protein [Corynebacterium sp. CNJ-954]|uniref:hypothetical protein n=1 Tax=Corynebacterium sp. CNJ-954 TaxID=1904962 RepID=UPI00351068EE
MDDLHESAGVADLYHLHGSLPAEPVERLPHRPAQCVAARCVPAWHPCHGDHSGDD